MATDVNMLMVKRKEGQYLGILNTRPNSVNLFIKLAIVHMDRDVISSITKSNHNLHCKLVVIKLIGRLNYAISPIREFSNNKCNCEFPQIISTDCG